VPYLPHTRPDHDETLIARLAVDDLDARDAATARTLVAECPACAELLTDLSLIASATAELPAASRTRDFRLTDADAARLRPVGWRGLVARFGTPNFAFTKPLATGLTTLGIVGLLLATIPANFGSASGSAALAPEAGFDTTAGPVQAQDVAGAPGAGALKPSGAPEIATGGKTATQNPIPASSGAAVSGQDNGTGGGAAAAPSAGVVAGPAVAAPVASADGQRATAERNAAGSLFAMTPLILLSLTLLVVGLAIGGLRLLGRRIV
jgi:hypothetical protein